MVESSSGLYLGRTRRECRSGNVARRLCAVYGLGRLLAWLGVWPLSWRGRRNWLVVWLGLAVLAPAVIRVEGLAGDDHLAARRRSCSAGARLAGRG